MLNTQLLHYRIFRYAVVGGIAFIADVGILYGLTSFAKTNYLLSAAVGFAVGLIINYFLSLRFVFADLEIRTKWTFEVFLTVGIVGLVLNELILGLFTEYFGFYYMSSKMISVFLVFLWNYGARKRLCFQEEIDYAKSHLHSGSGTSRTDSRI